MHRKEVITLVVLTDDDRNWKPRQYGYDRCGTHLGFIYSIAKLIEWEDKWEELEKDPNPCAVITMACLRTMFTRDDAQRRFQSKLYITRVLYSRGYTKDEVIAVLRFVDWIMELPEILTQQYDTAVRELEKEVGMEYRMGVEVQAEARGMQQGMQNSTLEILRAKFGQTQGSLVDAVRRTSDIETLQKIPVEAARAGTL